MEPNPINPNTSPIPPFAGVSPQPEAPHKGNSLWGILVVILVLLVAGFVWWWQSQVPDVQQPIVQQKTTPTPAAGEDTTAVIEADLNAIDVGDLDADFHSIDQDLQGL